METKEFSAICATLTLFRSIVVEKKSYNPSVKEFDMKRGLFSLVYGNFETIQQWYDATFTEVNKLNNTFYEKWKDIENTDQNILWMNAILHYCSTYGTGFEGEAFIPNPNYNDNSVKESFRVVVIGGMTLCELKYRILDLQKKGLRPENLEALMDIFDYYFTKRELKEMLEERIFTNHELITRLVNNLSYIPSWYTGDDILRQYLYYCSGQSLLINNKETICILENYKGDNEIFKGQERKIAECFLRHKDLFLAIRRGQPELKPYFNKIRRMAVKLHKVVGTPLIKRVTSELLDFNINGIGMVDTANICKAMDATAEYRHKAPRLYHIRNGKSWVTPIKDSGCDNMSSLREALMRRNFAVKGKRIFIPSWMNYACPYSDKSFIGNIPMGSSIIAEPDEPIQVGVYWENAWGARDLDLAGISTDAKVGWNARYMGKNSTCMFSGDITDAPEGAVEYFKVNHLEEGDDLLLTLNVYNGDPHSKYRIIVGRGSDTSYEKMMNPKNLLFECEDYIDKEKTLGMVASMDGRLHFAIAPMENGSKAVSRVCEKSALTLAAMSNKLHHRFSLKDFLEIAGAHIVEDSMDCDINLSPDKVTPSVFMDLMKTI